MARPPRSITPGGALLPLRLFLGLTFVYAGYQKLADPGFLHAGSATYIGTQLQQFAHGTPGGFLLRWFAQPEPKLAGVGVALAEIAIGLLVTAGLVTRIAAAAGLALNLLLFLTASWNTTPYFLGSDIVFVFAWLPFVLVGAEGQPSLDRAIAAAPVGRAAARRPHGDGVRVYGQGTADDSQTVTRQEMLHRALGGAAVLTLAIGAAATLVRLGRPQATTGLAVQGGTTGTSGHRHRHHTNTRGSSQTGGSSHTGGGSSPPSVPADAVKLGPSSSLGRGQAATYNDPGDGSPDIVIRQSSGSLTALSAVCTHAGCEVGYEGGVLVCPCHGSQFSATTGAVLQGPAVTPLAKKRVMERGGSIYAVPS
jgi:thiosulfate dehydrogenase [quinone] large subunit